MDIIKNKIAIALSHSFNDIKTKNAIKYLKKIVKKNMYDIRSSCMYMKKR